jgi:hypothetical protein
MSYPLNMKAAFAGLLSILAASIPNQTPAASSSPAETPDLRVAVELTDGSRVIGAPDVDRLELLTDYADLDLKLTLIRAIEYDADHRLARVTMQKGDELRGRLIASSLDLKTVFGAVAIPLAKVRRLSLTEAGVSGAGFGLQFDGRNYVFVPNDRRLDPVNAMTLECWFKTTASTGTTMVGKRRWEPNDGLGYRFRGEPGTFQDSSGSSDIDHGYQLHVDGGVLYAYWEHKLLAGGRVNDGRWHHAALTWDGTRRRLFQDGVKVAEDTPGQWVPDRSQFRIGAIDSTDGRAFFRGAIGQVRLSNIDRYQGRDFAPPANFTADADTVGCWKLNEGSGSTIGDCSGNGHDGELMGNPSPTWITEPPATPVATPSRRSGLSNYQPTQQ